jgi:hypothetical protein
MQPHDFIDVFIQPLEELGLEYMVTGSVAAIFYGEPRLTHDIDLVLVLSPKDVEPFCDRFDLEHYYCPPQDVILIELKRSHNAHFNLLHHQTGLKADCYLFTGDELHSWALANRRRVSLARDVKIYLAPCEYVIIRKVQYFKEGGSQKHLADVEAILGSSADQIDRAFLLEELSKRHLATFLPDGDRE